MGFLEIIFRTIIPASEMPFYDYDRVNNIRKFGYQNGAEGMRAIGVLSSVRAKWRVNNHGWNNASDYSFKRNSGKKRICIIGDSFIEGLYVDTDKNVGYKLNELLGNDKYEVYTFGQSGFPASAYLHLNRYIQEVYKPDMVIILLVENDFKESLVGFGNNFHLLFGFDETKNEVVEFSPVAPQYHVLLNKYHILKKSALVRYLYYNLKVHYWLVLRNNDVDKQQKDLDPPSPDTVKPVHAPVQSMENKKSVEEEQPDMFKTYYDYFLSQIREANMDNELLLMMNSGSCKGDVLDDLNKKVKKLSENKNVNYLDLTQPFYESYKKTGKHVCTSFIDPHWNELGHRVAAHAIYGYINEHGLLVDQ